jgi:MscS family membrane protein
MVFRVALNVKGTVMLNANRRRLFAILLISLLTLMLVFAGDFVQAQGSVATLGMQVTTGDQVMVQAQGTPRAQAELINTVEPTATSTTIPTATPEPYPGLSGELTDTLSDVDGQTVLNLVVSFAVVAMIAVFGGRLIYTLLRRITRRTKTEIDNLLLEAIRPLIGWLIAAIGFQIATSRLDFLSETAKEILGAVYFILYLFVAVSATWRVGDAAVDWYIDKRRDQLDANLVDQVVPLLKRLSHIALIIIGGIVLAGYFGINVLSISAALGLTGFAIALAAQDTIANIISGLVIMFDGPFKIGDRIEITGLDTWGDVVEIGIRSSKVVTRDNRLVIVPNSTIVDSAVINYSLPDTTYRLQSDIGIGYTMDIAKVQGLIKKTVHELEGVLQDKPVDVWFTEFGDSSMTFRVRWWVPSYAAKRRSTDRVNAAIQELAEREGIDMPNPTYALENKITMSDEDVQKIAKALKDQSST